MKDTLQVYYLSNYIVVYVIVLNNIQFLFIAPRTDEKTLRASVPRSTLTHL